MHCYFRAACSSPDFFVVFYVIIIFVILLLFLAYFLYFISYFISVIVFIAFCIVAMSLSMICAIISFSCVFLYRCRLAIRNFSEVSRMFLFKSTLYAICLLSVCACSTSGFHSRQCVIITPEDLSNAKRYGPPVQSGTSCRDTSFQF
ncbi:hypothetical protein [Blackfly microvirus SF02]|uniref:Uncharacterized protein n=1 Tax=Blackfly microvirus SF02 TaxID=2576452 RepID=A0A4P8PSA3_9VIRU|nr:hypothetical protein [Blackfly microvirus SF02]